MNGRIKFFALLLLCLVVVKTLIRSKKVFPKTKNEINREDNPDTATCGGVERWKIKVFTDSLANTIDFTPKLTTVSWLATHAAPVSYFTMPRYQPIEDSTYVVTCFLTIKKVETDSDYHLVLSDSVHTMIGEIPNPTCASVIVSPKVNEFIAARNWVDANIAAGDVFNIQLPPVTVTGVAFIDTAHGQTGAAPNQVELHSIIDIHFAATSIPHEMATKDITATVAPNPFNTSTTITIRKENSFAGNCEFELFDLHGTVVKKLAIPAKNNRVTTLKLNRENLKQGVYIYRVVDGPSFFEGHVVVE